MYKRLLLILVIVLPILAFMAVGGAGAACGDPAAPFVDWTDCTDEAGDDHSGANLVLSTLVRTDFTGTNLSGADMRFSNINGAIFTGANLSNAFLNLAIGTVDNSFAGANVQGLDLSSVVLERADFTGSTGTPRLNGTIISDSTCPDGTASTATSPYCTWTPTAITLAGVDVSAAANLWPVALFGLLLAGTVGYLLTRRGRKTAELPA